MPHPLFDFEFQNPFQALRRKVARSRSKQSAAISPPDDSAFTEYVILDTDIPAPRLDFKLPALFAHKDPIPYQHPAFLHRLPDNILLEIFEFLLSTDIPNYGPPVILVLGVCKRWRGVALGTPRLWSQLRFQHLGSPPSYPLAQVYLARSREHPIDVEFNKDIQLPVAGIVARAALRWRSLKLSCPDPNAATQVISLFLAQCRKHPSITPRLQVLDLWAYMYQYNRTAFEQAFDALAAIAKNVHTLHFAHIPPPRTTADFPRLTHLSVRDAVMDLSILEAILTRCARLRVLRLRLVNSAPSIRAPATLKRDTLINSPAIERLSIELPDNKILSFIATYLHVPSLRTLKIVPSNVGDSDEEIALFVRRNPCHTLELTHPLSEHMTHALHSSLSSPSSSSVQTFIIGRNDSYSLQQVLASIPENAFPHLVELRIETFLDGPGAIDAVRAFVHARSGGFRQANPLQLFFNCSRPYANPAAMEKDRIWFNQRAQVRQWSFEHVRFLELRLWVLLTYTTRAFLRIAICLLIWM